MDDKQSIANFNTPDLHGFSTVLQQNNYVKNEWQQVKYSDRRTPSDAKAKEVRDITAENSFFYTPLRGRIEKPLGNYK